MSESIHYPPEFENWVQSALSVPEPDPAFLDSLREQFLSPPIKELNTNSKYKGVFPRLTWGFALLVLVALIIAGLFSPPGVNALQRLLGYIPGVGVVEQSTSLRVLVAPVTQSRDAIGLTVEQAAATSDQTFVIYQYTVASDFVAGSPSVDPNILGPALRLPDGSTLSVISGMHEVADPLDPPTYAIRYRLEFGPLPEGVEHVTLLLPQLVGMPLGTGPEKWEIPLDFVLSTDGGLPVIEVSPSVTTTPQVASPIPSVTTPDLTHGISFALDKVVTLPDGNILMGHTGWNIAAPNDVGWYGMRPASVEITDAEGKEISFEEIAPEERSVPGLQHWSYKISAPDVHWPLTIQANDMYGSIDFQQPQDSFTFDPGQNPQPGQSWTMEHTIHVGSHTIQIRSVRLITEPLGNSYHYEFTMESSREVVGMSLVDAISGNGGGGGGIPEPGPFIANVYYEGFVGTGPIQVYVIGVQLLYQGSWQVSWSPPGQ